MTKSEKSLTQFEGKTNLAVRKKRVGQGSENVSASDIAIPILKLLQSTNDEVQMGNPNQIEGAQPGHIMDNVSHALSTALYVINLHFSRTTVVWKKRKLGGGMYGSYDSEAEAIKALEDAKESIEQFEIKDNPTHLVLVLSDEGVPKGASMLHMPGTKERVSKRWNKLINEQEEQGNPRFGCVWRLGVTAESNNEGNFYNYDVSLVTHAPDELFQHAEALYDSFFPESPIKDDEQEAA